MFSLGSKQNVYRALAGYLGRHVVAELLRRDFPVSALARDVSKAAAIPSAILVEGDVLQPQTLAALCEGVDIVISCLGSRWVGGQFLCGSRCHILSVPYRTVVHDPPKYPKCVIRLCILSGLNQSTEVHIHE